LSNTISIQQVNSDGNGVVTGSNNTPVWASQRTESYGYDDLSRLSTVNYGDGEQQSYQFDAMGNRTQKWDTITGTTSYSYNNANMLTAVNSNSYTNDANGNTLTGGARTNTWDSFNRMTQSVDGSNTCQYDYDFNGIRHQQAVTSSGTATTTDYGIDGDNVIREWASSNGSLSPQATYLTGIRGVEYKRFDQSGLVDWYINDGLGSVVAEINPNGSVQASQNYDVYGNIRTSSGTSQTTNHFVGNLGHQSDQATGLIYMRARYYDPACGRFISQDPARNGKNWFIYVSNNPVNLVDENGKAGTPPQTILGLAIWGLLQWFASMGLGPKGLDLLVSGLAGMISGMDLLIKSMNLLADEAAVSDKFGAMADVYAGLGCLVSTVLIFCAMYQFCLGAAIIAGDMEGDPTYFTNPKVPS